MLNQPLKKANKNHKKPSKTANIDDSVNTNPDAWLFQYENDILNLIRQKEAVQFVDNILGNDEAVNHCIIDQARNKSIKLNEQINHEIVQMAQFQAYTLAGLQSKDRVLKAVTSPLSFDEGFISYETNMLLTSLLMDTLGGVSHD